MGAESQVHRILLFAGYILVALAFIYISRSLWAYREWLLSWQITPIHIFLLGASILSYALSGFLLSSAWCILNQACGYKNISRRNCTAIYGTTQIAKYIPGNIFHFLGRHAAGVRMGLPHSTLACSASLEMIGLLFSASTISLLGLLVLRSALISQLPIPQWVLIAIIVAALLVMGMLLPLLQKKIGMSQTLSKRQLLGQFLMPSTSRYLVFFLVCGVIMALLTLVVMNSFQWTPLILAFFCYPISWIAGYVIPGASAGIGVREASIILILSTIILPQEASLIAILMRAVTILGDIVFYLIAKYVESTTGTTTESNL
jgi:uncharacterized membrane protein YbhN (UPF0104 family)